MGWSEMDEITKNLLGYLDLMARFRIKNGTMRENTIMSVTRFVHGCLSHSSSFGPLPEKAYSCTAHMTDMGGTITSCKARE